MALAAACQRAAAAVLHARYLTLLACHWLQGVDCSLPEPAHKGHGTRQAEP